MFVAGHVEIIAAVVTTTENAGDVRVTEAVAIGQRVPALVDPFGDRAGAHRTAALTNSGEVEDQPDCPRIILVDEELFLSLRPAHFHRSTFVAQRHGAAVEKAFLRVPPHRSTRMFGRFECEILVERGDDVAHHGAHRIVGKILRQRDQSDLGALEPREGRDLGFHAAGEARQGEDLDLADTIGGILDEVEHAVELGSAGILPALARLHEDPDYNLALRLGVRADLRLLAVERGAMIGLIVGRDADIADDPFGFGLDTHSYAPSIRSVNA
nr:hypothetical protein [uncultured Sphingomonas sp.]